MKKIESLQDAFDYVNQRYVFNNEVYPIRSKLTNEEKTFFDVKHSLQHLQINFCEILLRDGFAKSPYAHGGSREYFTNIIVYMIAISNTIKLLPNEITDTNHSSENMDYIAVPILNTIRNINIQCTIFDYEKNSQNLTQGVLCELKIKESLKKVFSELIYISKDYTQRVRVGMPVFTMDSIFNAIPDYMKS